VLVPHAVRDAVLAPAARLDEAAVVPGPAEPWLLEALTPMAANALDECLDAGIVVLADGRAAFRHEITRQVVEESLPPGLRAGLHRAALVAMAGQPTPGPGAAAAAHQGRRCRGPPGGREPVRAGAAVRGCDGAGRVDLLEGFTAMAFFTGMGEEAAAALREAVEIHRARGDLLRQGAALRLLAIQLG